VSRADRPLKDVKQAHAVAAQQDVWCGDVWGLVAAG
jgi:hypothetical protein